MVPRINRTLLLVRDLSRETSVKVASQVVMCDVCKNVAGMSVRSNGCINSKQPQLGSPRAFL